MIVDANVLLRILDGEEGAHAVAARGRVRDARDSGRVLHVFAATVLEVAFVLQSQRTGYGWARDDVAAAIDAIVDEPAFACEHGEALREAAQHYRARSVDLHDCYLHALAEQRGTRVLSFDDDLRRLGSGEKP
ncbi:MAG: PIN domain-containing protein [Patulibacter sp.]